MKTLTTMMGCYRGMGPQLKRWLEWVVKTTYSDCITIHMVQSLLRSPNVHEPRELTYAQSHEPGLWRCVHTVFSPVSLHVRGGAVECIT